MERGSYAGEAGRLVRRPRAPRVDGHEGARQALPTPSSEPKSPDRTRCPYIALRHDDGRAGSLRRFTIRTSHGDRVSDFVQRQGIGLMISTFGTILVVPP